VWRSKASEFFFFEKNFSHPQPIPLVTLSDPRLDGIRQGSLANAVSDSSCFGIPA